MTLLNDIKSIVLDIKRNVPKNKVNRELEKLKTYIKKSDVFKGKKKKMYKFINSNKLS